MPKKAKNKSAAKKTASRKAAAKTARKKTIRKKPAVKRKPVKKKAAVKKKALSKKVAKKTVKIISPKAKFGRGKSIPPKQIQIEPGPPPGGIPPVEEPASNEAAIGTVTHYYSHLSVAVIQVNQGILKTGDTIHIKGHGTDFVQKVASLEYEHVHVDQATAGQLVGLLVKDHAREHDIVYLVK